jgi:NAD(P)-dependent dehydrogenase (short-subunit alcohol dehydrogenase family)
MKLEGSVVLITGANRGLGLEFAKQALAAGAKKVYAAARDPSKITLPGVIPVKLDVTNLDDVATVASQCGDVTLLINNAGIAKLGGLVQGEPAALLREHMETNLYGVLNLSQAFAGTLGKNGGGAILNILSIVSWAGAPVLGAYAVTKAAAWGLTNNLRIELRPQGTQVVGLHVGFMDTDMARGFDAPKIAPQEVVAQAYQAIAAGAEEVLADTPTRQVREGLSHSVYLKDVLAG